MDSRSPRVATLDFETMKWGGGLEWEESRRRVKMDVGGEGV